MGAAYFYILNLDFKELPNYTLIKLLMSFTEEESYSTGIRQRRNSGQSLQEKKGDSDEEDINDTNEFAGMNKLELKVVISHDLEREICMDRLFAYMSQR